MEPQTHVPDLVFTANAGLVSGSTFVPSHFRHPERQPETPVFADWFAAAGFDVERLPEEVDHEGAGDALPYFDEPVVPSCCRATGPGATPSRGRSCPSCWGARCGRSSSSTSGCTTST